jgi:hypothetical protein
MPKWTFWDESYYLQRAEEAREMAEEMRHPECIRIMGGIALSYEHMARQTKEFRRVAAILRSSPIA